MIEQLCRSLDTLEEFTIKDITRKRLGSCHLEAFDPGDWGLLAVTGFLNQEMWRFKSSFDSPSLTIKRGMQSLFSREACC